MAVVAPLRSTQEATGAVLQVPKLPVAASSVLRERLLNAIPLTGSLFIASSIFWAPVAAPAIFAVAIIGFFAYWLVRSYAVLVSCVIGMRRIGRWERTNWAAKYCAWLPDHPDAPRWDSPRHMVIIPNYKEGEEGLTRTLASLAAQANAGQLVIVMAMEDREAGCRAKAAKLITTFHHHFADMFATYHPSGLPGETPGKGSNEAWAAREAHIRLIEEGEDDIRRFTITSCDADALFHPHHFEALNYLFLTSDEPYRTFWQPAIFNSNNIWDIPAPLRIPDGLSGINRLSNLVMPGSVRFPTSCYSVSWEMLRTVDYWDEEVIPEDWHIFLKCCFSLGDRVSCQPLYLPLGNDCVLADGYRATLKAHYTQSVRHAWGASDIPYALRSSVNPRSPLGGRRRFLLSGAVTKVHMLWMSQWYLVTLGNIIPALLTNHSPIGRMPEWSLMRIASLPGPTWHISEVLHGDFSDPMGGRINVNIAGALIYFCLFPLIGMIIMEFRARGPRPEYVSRKTAAAGLLMWPLMGVITFFFASMPALHAQWKLASGKGLIYQVAEKGRRREHRVAAGLAAEGPAEPLPSMGGGQ